MGGGAGAPDKSGNVFGTISLIAGIVSIVVCCLYAGVWAGIPAIVLGVISRKKAAAGQATNGNLGTVGMILGIVGVVIFLVLIILAASGVSTDWAKQLQNQS
ncbi:MAG: hypothetical protein WCA46_16390 [Actinocatenispora sp.]